MTTGLQLDAIDRLRELPFPGEHRGSYGARSGPGYHLVALPAGSPSYGADEDPAGQEDPGREEERREQVSAEYAALVGALTGRWGPPQVLPFLGVRDRVFSEAPEAAAVPEPWRELCQGSDHAQLWWVTERYVAVCATDWGAGWGHGLTAAVTTVDPP
ncbi:hypothetical protein [Streptomyces sp. NPDC097619]|uniref:hypothetical protein n=1 Tax=Streptomyces sp. NPDC097619 TaxID=3157228 RepID=UPI003322A8E8